MYESIDQPPTEVPDKKSCVPDTGPQKAALRSLVLLGCLNKESWVELVLRALCPEKNVDCAKLAVVTSPESSKRVWVPPFSEEMLRINSEWHIEEEIPQAKMAKIKELRGVAAASRNLATRVTWPKKGPFDKYFISLSVLEFKIEKN